MNCGFSPPRSWAAGGVTWLVPDVRETNSAEAYTPAADEAFGQSGVRQHLGVLLNGLCITLMLISLAMWGRSIYRSDEMAYRAQSRAVTVQSSQGRLLLSAATFPTAQFGNTGWIFRPRTITARSRDRWPESIYKTIGIEWRATPLQTGATSGAWFMVKWYFLAAVFAAFPALRAVRRYWANRSEA